VVTFHWAADPNALHTMTLVPSNVTSDRQINRLFPGGGGPIPDTDDAGSGPTFPFNKFQQKCGNSPYYPGTAPCVYTGTNLVNSGFLVPAVNNNNGKLIKGVPLPSFSVRFNAAPGTYRFFCLVHGPAMNGSITVLPSSAPTTSPSQAVAQTAKQYNIQNQNAIASESKIKHGPVPGAAGHTNFIVSAGSQFGKIEMDQFYPAVANIKAGDSVTWTPGGFHTVTFPPPAGPAIAPMCELPGGKDRPFAGQFAGCDLEVVLGPGAVPSGNPAAYAGGTLGSGILVVPQPHAFTVTFTKPGKYLYFCLVHFNMGGFVNVS
jgi:plastocyanin